MPNIWTHIMFCEEILDSIEDPIYSQDAQVYFNLGAQGPDPFFYHNFWPWNKDERVNNIGSVIHQQYCGFFLLDLIKNSLNKSNNTKAYVLGFVTHHILDRNTHPYIHYRAGYKGSDHQKLEVIIDTIMMNRFRNADTWKVPVYKEIDVGPTLDKEIADLLHHNIENYFGEEIADVTEEYIQESYRDMKRALKILFDPYGWKNRLLSSMISSYSHQPLKTQKDFLNDELSTWYHPSTNEPQQHSFLELYEQARKEGIEILTAVVAYWEYPNEANMEKLEQLISNISYDTGKHLDENLELRYCDPIV
ncbi:hypothetical protein HNQ94_003138 [Salirhabdus euzebyi]|uniref:Phospholipase C/D domain-containing protein n=1 Tax=Salirhabdus euzebyi TaxID=394506 RepID=A0A841Q7T9_9BACI|nr:zinc dependent phospholipase C family protein [Salirhabdus euzebyi]MBB6454649.1 hypothetical protein [Salirhabdus euzebyi]